MCFEVETTKFVEFTMHHIERTRETTLEIRTKLKELQVLNLREKWSPKVFKAKRCPLPSWISFLRRTNLYHIITSPSQPQGCFWGMAATSAAASRMHRPRRRRSTGDLPVTSLALSSLSWSSTPWSSELHRLP